MKKKKFIEKFTLRMRSHPETTVSVQEAIRQANIAWEALQESFRATKSRQLSHLYDLAEQALLTLESGRYIAQDKTGDWFVFENQPELDPTGQIWHYSMHVGRSARFAKKNPPEDHTKECYLISDILGIRL